MMEPEIRSNERLRKRREDLSKTVAEVAAASGLNEPSYYDAEDDEEEIFSNISLEELKRLSRTLDVDLAWLLTGHTRDKKNVLGFSTLADLIKTHLRENRMKVEEFENRVGYEIQACIVDPSSIGAWNVDCLQSVASTLGINWVDALPV